MECKFEKDWIEFSIQPIDLGAVQSREKAKNGNT